MVIHDIHSEASKELLHFCIVKVRKKHQRSFVRALVDNSDVIFVVSGAVRAARPLVPRVCWVQGGHWLQRRLYLHQGEVKVLGDCAFGLWISARLRQIRTVFWPQGVWTVGKGLVDESARRAG